MARGKPTGQGYRQYLDAMGIPVWQRRPGIFPEHEKAQESSHLDEQDVVSEVMQEQLTQAETPERVFSEYHTVPIDASPAVTTETDSEPAWDWESLRDEVDQCRACEISRSRSNAVFGVGNEKADWFIIGEAPAKDEDQAGEPFVGPAGQLLNDMLLAIGLKREDVFITNVLKCHPPTNRDPRPEEIANCENFLARQIEWIKPKIILSIGKESSRSLLKSKDKLDSLRGRVHHYGSQETPLVVTYHPAHLLRVPLEKRKAWDDLKLAMRVIRGQS